MSLGPTLTTARLVLRPPILADFDDVAAFMADPETAQFLGGTAPRSVVWRSFAALVGSWHLLGFSFFSVVERDTGRWVGRLGPWRPEGWPGNEVGWGIVKDRQGRGYAVEGATAAMDWAFDCLGWTEVIHCIAPENVASQAVAKKLGSTLQGPVQMPEPFTDVRIEAWGQTRQQWRDRRR